MGNNPPKAEGRSPKPSSADIQRQNEAFFKEQREKFEAEYQKVLEAATITGNTWIEFEHNLKQHIEDGSFIRTEWNYLSEKEAQGNNQDLFKSAISAVNKEKNRYVNILPYETTRVKLSEIEGVLGSDYINANHVSTGDRPYICCSAPLRETLPDFHRMLWETRVKVIVMLTKFVEGGKPKAIEYLPPVGEPTKYGDIEVEVKEEKNHDDVYVVRKFTLKKGEEVHELTQFHFLAWPDFGVPHLPKPLLDMILTVNNLEDDYSANNNGERVPTVVHCSAGIGRTGTYIAVNGILEHITQAMKKDANTPPSINLMKTIHLLRTMRTGMVNAPDQYEYCYQTILEHVQELLGIKVEKTPARRGMSESSNDPDETPEQKPKKKKKKKKAVSAEGEEGASGEGATNSGEGGEKKKKKKKKKPVEKKEGEEGSKDDNDEKEEGGSNSEEGSSSPRPAKEKKKKKKVHRSESGSPRDKESSNKDDDNKDKDKDKDKEKGEESGEGAAATTPRRKDSRGEGLTRKEAGGDQQPLSKKKSDKKLQSKS